MMLPLWFVLLLCMMSAAMGFFACSMMVIAKHQDRQQAQQELSDALRTMLAAVNDQEPEKFPGHHKAYLQQVAIPRARAALCESLGTQFSQPKGK